MAQAINEERRTLYLDPRLGWTEQETPDAKLKLSSLWRMQTTGLVENQLWTRFDRGGWQELNPSQESQLSGAEQGYVFEVKPRQGEAGQFMEIRSARYVDQQMAGSLLEGIPLFDSELRPLAGPQLAVNCFCVPATHAHTFAQRVQSRGGLLTEAQADLQHMYGRLGRLGEIVQALEALCAQSRTVIDQVASGMQTEVPGIGERSSQAHQLREEAARIVAELHDGKLAADRVAGQVELQGHAAAYAEHGEGQMRLIEKLHREHMSYEAQATMRVKESTLQTLPGLDSPATTRRYLLHPVVEYYTDLGYDCRMIEGGMILRIGDTVVELSDKPHIRQAGAELSAEQLLGRHTAERTQREL